MIPADLNTRFELLLAAVVTMSEDVVTRAGTELSAADIITGFGLLLAACLMGGMIANGSTSQGHRLSFIRVGFGPDTVLQIHFRGATGTLMSR